MFYLYNYGFMYNLVLTFYARLNALDFISQTKLSRKLFHWEIIKLLQNQKSLQVLCVLSVFFFLSSLDQYHLFVSRHVLYSHTTSHTTFHIFQILFLPSHLYSTIQNKQSFLLLLKTCFLLSLGADTASHMVGLKCFENRCYKRNNLQDTELQEAPNLLLECISGPGCSPTPFILDPGWQLGNACV